MIDFSKWPKPCAAKPCAAKRTSAIPYFDPMAEVKRVESLFSLGDKHDIIARNNLHTLKGSLKTGKSAWGLILMVAALKGEFLGIKARYNDMKILWIDTEQDEATLHDKAQAVMRMAGLNTWPERIKMVAFCNYDGAIADMLATTLDAIEENPADFVFLDGVVDLCTGFNDEKSSMEAVIKLLRKAQQTGAAILGLIHINKNDTNARGHLGGIFEQKSADIYLLKNNGGIAKVLRERSRNAAPGLEFSFSFADNYELTSPTKPLAEFEKIAILAKEFAALLKNGKMNAKDLTQAYAKKYNKCPRVAQDCMSDAVSGGVLAKEKDGIYTYYSLTFGGISSNDNDDDL